MAKPKGKKSGLSPEDQKLLEQAKQAQKDMKLELDELRKIFEADLEDEIDKMRQEKEAALEKEMSSRKASFEDELRANHKDLVSEIDNLEEQRSQIMQEVSGL